MKIAKKVKFCGLTRPADVAAAVQAGADAIGLVFYPPSPRAVDIAQAKTLASGVPAFVSVVALVVNISDEQLVEIANAVPFDIIQFHGDETAADCQRQAKLVNKRWIKALRIDATCHDAAKIFAMTEQFAQAGAAAILLDAYHADKFGGTGERFDWSLIDGDLPLPVILAGGLTVENVAQTADLPIYAVDVSGGIEQAHGIKDAQKMQDFIKNLNNHH
ncbi:phosphoribosylanthranilate isomerase [Moraxella marmotae]|uniref:phosphoribosylanthranilate isomerase n=1 Tax=Moraxella marmotae TaxID=3344520 RepID=UPI0035F290ED